MASQFIMIVGLLHAQDNASHQRKSVVDKIDALNKTGVDCNSRKSDTCLSVLQEANALAVKENYHEGIAQSLNNLGVYHRNQDNYKLAQKYFFEALEIYEKRKDLHKIAYCKNNIGNLFNLLGNSKKAIFYYTSALDVYIDLKEYLNYGETCNNLGGVYRTIGDNKNALKYFKEGLKYLNADNDVYTYSKMLFNTGLSYSVTGIADSADLYFGKALVIFKEIKYTEGLSSAYYEIGYRHEVSGDYQKAIKYYHMSLSLARELKSLSLMDNPLEGLMMVHNVLKHSDSVEFYYYELVDVNGKLFEEKTNKNIQDVETKYQTEKKEQALVTERERRAKIEEVNKANRQTISFLSIAVALALVLILGIWAYQSQKQQIISLNLQQKNDEIERMINEQQVKTYESQLEGEAQERRRIASELHDRVGGLLATLNLHFEVLTEKRELLEEGNRIQHLIKASIDEVRTISHNLHGVGRTNGLQNSLEQLRAGISSSGRLQMDLFYEIGDTNLPEEMSSELYKIVQELTTNTLKHAQASKIIVQLSLIENVLHLIYEDNGKGFDVAAASSGIGIVNVGERVDKCNGNWHIDSKIGRGTTVIINIPLE